MLPCQRLSAGGEQTKMGVNFTINTTERKVLETKWLYHHLATEANNHYLREKIT